MTVYVPAKLWTTIVRPISTVKNFFVYVTAAGFGRPIKGQETAERFSERLCKHLIRIANRDRNSTIAAKLTME